VSSSAPTATSTELAVDRTRLAHDRTIMAWVRTAASLISFGFTIYKFFQYLREQGHGGESRLGPREFALLLIGIGLFSLLLATIQSRHEMRIIRKHYGHVPYSLANIVAGMVALLGVLTFIAVILRQ
jgi:inner membrane protein YidH